jgi:hypothetical protein
MSRSADDSRPALELDVEPSRSIGERIARDRLLGHYGRGPREPDDQGGTRDERSVGTEEDEPQGCGEVCSFAPSWTKMERMLSTRPLRAANLVLAADRTCIVPLRPRRHSRCADVPDSPVCP